MQNAFYNKNNLLLKAIISLTIMRKNRIHVKQVYMCDWWCKFYLHEVYDSCATRGLSQGCFMCSKKENHEQFVDVLYQ